MSRRHGVGPKVARRLQEVGELDVLIAAHAGDRRLAGEIAFGEGRDDLFAKAALVVEHVMRDPELRRDRACVMDVAPCAAGPLARCGFGRSGIIKLQRDADDIVAVARQHGRHDGRIHAARHRDDDPRGCGGLGESEGVEGGCVIHWQQRNKTRVIGPCSNAFAGALPAPARAAGSRPRHRRISSLLQRKNEPQVSRKPRGLGSFLRAAAAIVTLSKPKRLSNAAGWLSQVLSSEA